MVLWFETWFLWRWRGKTNKRQDKNCFWNRPALCCFCILRWFFLVCVPLPRTFTRCCRAARRTLRVLRGWLGALYRAALPFTHCTATPPPATRTHASFAYLPSLPPTYPTRHTLPTPHTLPHPFLLRACQPPAFALSHLLGVILVCV